MAASRAERPGGNWRYNKTSSLDGAFRGEELDYNYLSSLLLPFIICIKLVKWVFRRVFLEMLCEKFFACRLNE